jgi:hypothetical protein
MTTCAMGTTGTTKAAISKHTKPSKLMAQNRPDNPNSPTSTGDNTSDAANDRPIDPPTMAMARVRTSGRVASATQAVMAADTAPTPCMTRPTVTPSTEPARAHTTPPRMNRAMPNRITGRRPKRSDAMPSGI